MTEVKAVASPIIERRASFTRLVAQRAGIKFEKPDSTSAAAEQEETDTM